MTGEIHVELQQQPAAFAPGEPIRGSVRWSASHPPRSVRVSLLWSTEGRGTRDVGVAHTLNLENPQQNGERPIEFTAPAGPCSFTGELITLEWAVEAVIDPGELAGRATLVIAPLRRPITLGSNG
jgi:hypothetical protein